MSRPTIISEEIINKIEEALKAGNYVITSCEYAGISKDAYYDWMHKSADPNSDPIYKRFSETVEKARAQAEVRNVMNIQKSAQNGQWQASAWWLERSFPDKWGRRTTVTGPDNGPIQVDVTRDQITERILSLLNNESETED